MHALDRVFAADGPPLVVAEVGLGHDGSLGLAHAYIDTVAAAGGEAIKFQTHIAEAESSPLEPFRVQFSRADKTRTDYWRRTGFTEEQWVGLKQHADERKVMFLSSPFSGEAVDLLERVGVPAWKVPSGEISSRHMLDRMLATSKPIILSTGMCSYAAVDAAVEYLTQRGSRRHAVLQCTTSYPTGADQVGLNVMTEFAKRYRCPVGLSDHSGTPVPGLLATWLGARLIEVHVTMSRDMFGPDVSSSLTMESFKTLLDGVSYVARMRDNPVDKDALASKNAHLRDIFGKSAFAAIDIRAGAPVEAASVAYRKPGYGIDEARFERFINRRAARDVAAGTMFQEEDFLNE